MYVEMPGCLVFWLLSKIKAMEFMISFLKLEILLVILPSPWLASLLMAQLSQFDKPGLTT